MRVGTPSLQIAAVFALAAAVFLPSPVHQWTDSEYSILLSEHLLRRGDVWLDEYFARRPAGRRATWPPYQIEEVDGRLTHSYPHGGPILSMPFVSLANLAGVSAIGASGQYDPHGERVIQAVLASLLMAGFTATMFVTCRLVLDARWSALLAIGGSLGSQVWSTMSRALWLQTWQVFLLGLAVLILVGHARGRWPSRPVLLATVLCWAFFTRPLSAIPLAGVGVYLLWTDRGAAVRYGAACTAWLVGMVAYSMAFLGRPLPTYYLALSSADSFRLENAVVGLAGLLLSPSRGLLVFVPSVLFVAYLLVRYRRRLPFRPLVLLALAVVAVHTLLVSGWTMWWGGHSYGPRLLSDVVPWLLLLGLAGVRGMLDGGDRDRQGSGLARFAPIGERLAGAALLTLSVAINGRGALAWETHEWNAVPFDVDVRTERLWDWSDPQFLATLRSRPGARILR